MCMHHRVQNTRVAVQTDESLPTLLLFRWQHVKGNSLMGKVGSSAVFRATNNVVAYVTEGSFGCLDKKRNVAWREKY
jgi:hypothetical protein